MFRACVFLPFFPCAICKRPVCRAAHKIVLFAHLGGIKNHILDNLIGFAKNLKEKKRQNAVKRDKIGVQKGKTLVENNGLPR
ncbi:MAG: hypothetical protein HFI41_09785 [Lachnospiraceae bacterium]|nr:hypothetical protein [Lachnospiraceae bacterium]